MKDNNQNENKKTFEEILNDLNSILEKMPDVVKETNKPAQNQEKANKNEKEELKDDNLNNQKNKSGSLTNSNNDEIKKDINSGDKNEPVSKKEEINNEEKDKKDFEDNDLSEVKSEEVIPYAADEDMKIEILDPNKILSEEKSEDKAVKEEKDLELDNINLTETETKKDTSQIVSEVVKGPNEISKDIPNSNNDDMKIETNQQEFSPQEQNKSNNIEGLSENAKNSEDIKEIDIKIEDEAVIKDSSNLEKPSAEGTKDTIGLKATSDELVIDNKLNIENKEQIFSDSNIITEFSIELNKLISKETPQSVSKERVKNVGFIFSCEEGLLSDILNTMDSICLHSKEKPMFVKRAFVLPFDDKLSIESILINCKNESACAVALAGEVPPERIYEIENALSQNNIYFANFTKLNFSKSKIIDFIMELIIR